MMKVVRNMATVTKPLNDNYKKRDNPEKPTKRASVTIPHFTESHNTRRLRATNKRILRSLRDY